MVARRQRPGQRRQVGLELPIARHGLASAWPEAVEVGLEMAGCPQLVEGHVEVTGEQRGATGLAVAGNLHHQMLGDYPLGFGIALTALARARREHDRGGYRDRRPDRQCADRLARRFVQLGTQSAGAERRGTAGTPLGRRVALAAQHVRRSRFSIGTRSQPA